MIVLQIVTKHENIHVTWQRDTNLMDNSYADAYLNFVNCYALHKNMGQNVTNKLVILSTIILVHAD